MRLVAQTSRFRTRFEVDFARLRDVLAPLIENLKDAGTHSVLPSICEALGLPAPDPEGSKRERMLASFNALPDAHLPDVAQRFLLRYPPSPATRNTIQDILWADSACPDIPKRFRREVAQAVDIEELFEDAQQFDALLNRLWILDTDPWAGMFSNVRTGLRKDIEQHVHRNRGDWSTEFLFDKLGANTASNGRFVRFLEGLASSDVRPNEVAQRRFVATINIPLRNCGVELRETDIDGGYPVFSAVATHAAAVGRPKNLIFASAIKPDLRFRDAVNNDIEIVTNADKVLVYDRPIGMDGLLWSDLQLWWGETSKIADAAVAKKSLYRRLRESLPPNSPPQALLFSAFYRGFGSAVPELPALLPEVWLHWDSRTVKERGRDALLRFRMDFLLLLPQGVRIVIEVDGKHHYADEAGRADVVRYAQMAAADRELKLAGYQIFRFGAHELLGDSASAAVKTFFEALFKRYGVPVSYRS
jgi:very-short-patch-repair endonuclease